jgi:16S rRNA (cytidine1402-2'-O)-methyltransferase
MGTLYIVGTPIGNLGDITLRALDTLKLVDVVLAEDTRVVSRLLTRYEISKPLVSVHEHTDERKLGSVVERLVAGESMAFVSDAGSPGVADPGARLVALARISNVTIIPIPGVSAVTTLISIAGLNTQEFTFVGFVPHKKGRETLVRRMLESETPTVYFDSPHRVVKNLELIHKMSTEFGYTAHIVLGRELTKIYEELLTGDVATVLATLQARETIKGEIVVLVVGEKVK